MDAPKIYDDEGNYRGKFSTNPYDSDSISNPYGRYGSPIHPKALTIHTVLGIHIQMKNFMLFLLNNGGLGCGG